MAHANASLSDSLAWSEQEWWYDADRLHCSADLARMRAAHTVIMHEALLHGLVSRGPVVNQVDVTVLERASNDIGREMEVLLYGRAGGFALKTTRSVETHASAIQIQCLYGAFSLVRRVRRRRQRRVLVAALYIQKLYKRRLSFFLSDQVRIAIRYSSPLATLRRHVVPPMLVLVHIGRERAL